jgi:hypothetical protein
MVPVEFSTLKHESTKEVTRSQRGSGAPHAHHSPHANHVTSLRYDFADKAGLKPNRDAVDLARDLMIAVHEADWLRFRPALEHMIGSFQLQVFDQRHDIALGTTTPARKSSPISPDPFYQ